MLNLASLSKHEHRDICRPHFCFLYPNAKITGIKQRCNGPITSTTASQFMLMLHIIFKFGMPMEDLKVHMSKVHCTGNKITPGLLQLYILVRWHITHVGTSPGNGVQPMTVLPPCDGTQNMLYPSPSPPPSTLLPS